MEENRKYTNWDDGVYGTGPMEPPKKHNGTLAVLLILIIFLCGIVTLLSVMNIKLFQRLQLREETLAITFDDAKQETVGTQPEAETGSAPKTQESATFDLHQSPSGAENVPQEGGLSLQEIYRQCAPSVVSISSTRSGGTTTGTGVIFTEDGLLLTNAHVVDGALSVSVQLMDDRVFPAEIRGQDEISDLAVLKIGCTGLTPAQFGDSDALRVGDTVVAIGDPLGIKFRGTFTDGIVSAINRDVEVSGHTMTLIQTNAALNSGNSGGPLINCYGQVVGINTMKIGAFADSTGVEGLGFAIPSATVRDIVCQLLSQGYVSGRPTLGITGESLPVFYRHYYSLPSGLVITGVERASDAYEKGLQDGDILTTLNGVRVTSMNELSAAIGDLEVGDMVTVNIYRSGKNYQVELTLTEDKG